VGDVAKELGKRWEKVKVSVTNAARSRGMLATGTL